MAEVCTPLSVLYFFVTARRVVNLVRPSQVYGTKRPSSFTTYGMAQSDRNSRASLCIVITCLCIGSVPKCMTCQQKHKGARDRNHTLLLYTTSWLLRGPTTLQVPWRSPVPEIDRATQNVKARVVGAGETQLKEPSLSPLNSISELGGSVPT